ncbi:MAG: 3-dehydroquinate synthase [bacterium]
MESLSIELGDRSYPIKIGEGVIKKGFLSDWVAGRKLLVVSNTTVAPLYLQKLTDALGSENYESLILPDGEQYKNIESWQAILNKLIKMRADRNCCLIAIGGGVIGDMTGYAAASYMRGVDFIQIPTTLLAQVDASVGGKTGINHPQGKNLIGAFHQPQAVIIDTNSLHTLPIREYRAGLAEVVKYGLIIDAKFFAWMENNAEALAGRDPKAVQYAIFRSCQIKAEVVAADEREAGVRALLNLGHTYGHAIETATSYTRYLHGEAVAIGMYLAAKYSEQAGIAMSSFSARGQQLMQKLGLQTELPDDLDVHNLVNLMQLDKKVINGRLRLVVMKNLGEAVVQDDADPELIAKYMKS